MTGYICSAPLYEYEHNGRVWRFEYGSAISPWPIRKDDEPYKRAGRRFYDAFEAWHREPDREKYRIGGGCIPFGEGA